MLFLGCATHCIQKDMFVFVLCWCVFCTCLLVFTMHVLWIYSLTMWYFCKSSVCLLSPFHFCELLLTKFNVCLPRASLGPWVRSGQGLDYISCAWWPYKVRRMLPFCAIASETRIMSMYCCSGLDRTSWKHIANMSRNRPEQAFNISMCTRVSCKCKCHYLFALLRFNCFA